MTSKTKERMVRLAHLVMGSVMGAVIALPLFMCQSKNPTAAPAPSATASTSASAAPAPAVSSAPAPPAGVAPTPKEWWVLSDRDLEELVGRWVSVKNGDAIPKGSMGGVVVDGGIRVDIVKDRKGSRTPYNLRFWAPREGHRLSTNISGGCGFYDTIIQGPDEDKDGKLDQWLMNGYCRGYGLPAQKRAHHQRILFRKNTKGHIHLTIGTILDEKLKRPGT